MNDLNKHQLVLLALLVSFVTALVTAIVVFTLMSQTPPPITETIQKVVERVVDKSVNILPEPLKKDETKELELAALARDVLIEDVVSRASPAVVKVIATKDIPVVEQIFVKPFDDGDPLAQLFPDVRIPQIRQRGTERQQVSSASGFFVSSDGFIVTNRHVVEDADADYTAILNDERRLKVKVLARDPLHDVAILKTEGDNFNFVTLGNSESARVGHTVVVIGSPLEFPNTVSVGVVSGLRRTLIASGSRSGPEEIFEAIQTDAAINLGNSGGPVLNLRGEAIGLATAVAIGAENIGFAIPVNQVKKSIRDTKEKGKIIYPYVGVRYATVNPEIKEKHKLPVDYGALVIKGSQGEPAVIAGSPAAKSGLKEGDVILEFAGARITRENSLAKLIQERSIGDKVVFKLLRDGKELDIELALEERKNF